LINFWNLLVIISKPGLNAYVFDFNDNAEIQCKKPYIFLVKDAMHAMGGIICQNMGFPVA
jgi:hypothetical protein